MLSSRNLAGNRVYSLLPLIFLTYFISMIVVYCVLSHWAVLPMLSGLFAL